MSRNDRGQFVVSRRFNFEGPGNFRSGREFCAWAESGNPATEIKAIRDQLFKLANTQSPMGDYIFAGHATDRLAAVDNDGNYEFQGDNGQCALNIAASVTVNVRTMMRMFSGRARLASFRFCKISRVACVQTMTKLFSAL